MTAAEVLLKAEITCLPVDLNQLAAHFGVKIVSYGTVTRYFHITMRELYEISRCGFGFYADDRYICAINENVCNSLRQRWTIAHELAHFFLGHIARGHIADVHNEKNLAQEREADLFAGELLCPLAAVNFCGVASAQELARLCGISAQAADIRFDELCRLRYSCSQRLRDGYGGVFQQQTNLTPAEMLLISQLTPFIGKYLLERARFDGYEKHISQKTVNE